MKIPKDAPRIRTGQIWVKKDTGLRVQITGRRGVYYATKKLGGSRKTHGITGKDLLLFFTLEGHRAMVVDNYHHM